MMMFPKTEKKPKKKNKSVPPAVMEKVRERTGGICEYCGKEKATQPHHIYLKSRRGLDIPVNILHVCWKCHDNSNIQFLYYGRKVLKKRIDELFNETNKEYLYTKFNIAKKLEISESEVDRQMRKEFLKSTFYYTEFLKSGRRCSTKEQIKIWLGVHDGKNNIIRHTSNKKQV